MRVAAAALRLAGLLVLAGWPAPSKAQEYCVVCADPAAVYRCVIGDARLAKGQPLQDFCVSTMAKEGGHASCGLRHGTVFDCDGPIKRVATEGAASKSPAGAAPLDQSKDAAAKQKDAAAKESAPPATVEQLAKQMSRSSGRKIEETGQSVGDTAKKAWTCFTSLFKSC